MSFKWTFIWIPATLDLLYPDLLSFRLDQTSAIEGITFRWCCVCIVNMAKSRATHHQ